MRRARFVALLLLTLGPIFSAASAQISPGKLSRYHEKLEGIANCTSCHELGKREIASGKCFECHKALQARVAAGTGYHSSSDVRGAACSECHSEHNGRDFQLVHWKTGQENFDHGKTAYALEGAHRRAGCRDCHKPAFITGGLTASANVSRERTFLGLDAACLACHADEHGEQLTDNCLDCHGYEAWSPAPKFSHSKTKYPLTGRHLEVDCAKCHTWRPAAGAAPGKLVKRERAGVHAQYAGLEFVNCAPCHRDPHENRFGSNCRECHTIAGFRQVAGNRFDHSRTDFPLRGRHVGVACNRCHTSGRTTDPVAHARCADCHKDTHGGQFADRADKGACESCHTVDGFAPATYSLEHHRDSRYPLTGSHLAVPCLACHAAPAGSAVALFDFADLTCKGCHADVHRGQLDKWIAQGGCEFCHGTETWHRTTFDHKLSRFALEGRHREQPCLKCHTVKQVGTGADIMWMKPVAVECASCHRDPHHGQFIRTERGEPVTECGRCHTPSGWRELTFVHNRDSRFALDGAHARVACAACHRPQAAAGAATFIVYRPLQTECAACHAAQR